MMIVTSQSPQMQCLFRFQCNLTSYHEVALFKEENKERQWPGLAGLARARLVVQYTKILTALRGTAQLRL